MANIADGELTAVALCWTLERSDGAGLALTSHDREILRGGTRYEPAPGMTPASVSRSLGLDANSGEVSGAFDSAALSATDLALGRWTGAGMRLTAVDWADPDAPDITLLGGELGEVVMHGETFSAELRGAASRLLRPACPTTSPECRAQLGDKQCRVDMAGRTRRIAVVEANGSELRFAESVDAKFLFGRLRFLSGANCGLASTIIAVDGATLRVRDLPRAEIQAGAIVELREGCDKRFATCVERFDNAVNFRGEPHLPGNDLLTRYPGA